MLNWVFDIHKRVKNPNQFSLESRYSIKQTGESLEPNYINSFTSGLAGVVSSDRKTKLRTRLTESKAALEGENRAKDRRRVQRI